MAKNPAVKCKTITENTANRIREDYEKKGRQTVFASSWAEYGPVTLVTATGRARCRQCCQKIAKGEKALSWVEDMGGSGSFTSTGIQIHLEPCKTVPIYLGNGMYEISENPPAVTAEVIETIRALLKLERDRKLDERNRLAMVLFNQKGLRNFKTDNGRVETWWDKQSRNWVTQRFDEKDYEVESDYSGDQLGAALSHFWALATLLVEELK